MQCCIYLERLLSRMRCWRGLPTSTATGSSTTRLEPTGPRAVRPRSPGKQSTSPYPSRGPPSGWCSCGTAPSRPTFEVVRQAPGGAPPHATACEGRPQACIERAKARSLELLELVPIKVSEVGRSLSFSPRWLSVYTAFNVLICFGRTLTDHRSLLRHIVSQPYIKPYYLTPGGAATSTPLSPYKPLPSWGRLSPLSLEAPLATQHSRIFRRKMWLGKSRVSSSSSPVIGLVEHSNL